MYYDKNIKGKNIEKKIEEYERKEILLSIIKTKIDLENSIKNYEFAEGGLIDYYLYQIKANQSKLDYLIKEAKNREINLTYEQKIKYGII